MNRKVSLGFGAFALILTALVAIPQFINLEGYKPKVEKRLKRLLGRDVKINGDVTFSLLPNLGLTIKDVTVANDEWAKDPHILTAKEVTASFALFPLLTKTVEISQVSFIEPTLNLDQQRNGRNNWEHFTTHKAEGSTAKPSSWTLSPSIPRVTVQKGVLKFQQGTNALHVSDYQLSVKSISNSGPFVIQGHLFFEEHKVDYTINVGDTSGEKIDVDSHFDSAANSFQVKGKVDRLSQSFNGAMASKLNLDRLTIGLIKDAQKLNVTADVAIDANKISLTNLKGKTATYQTAGQAHVMFDEHLSFVAQVDDLPGGTQVKLNGPLTKATKKMGDLHVSTQDLKLLSAWVLNGSGVELPTMPAEMTTTYSLSLDQLKLDKLVLNLEGEQVKGFAHVAWGEKPSVNTNLTFKGGLARLTGEYDPSIKDVRGDLTFSHPRFGAFVKRVLPDTDLNIDQFNFSGKLVSQDQKLKMKDLKMLYVSKAKSSSVEGEADVMLLKNNFHITGQFASKYLDLDAPFSQVSHEKWSDRNFWPQDIFNGFSGQLRLSVDQLVWAGVTLDKVEIPVTLEDRQLSAPVTAVAGGAPFTARISVEQASPWVWKLDSLTNNANLNPLLTKALGQWFEGGKVDTHIKLRTTGLSKKSWMENLRGSLQFKATKGTIKAPAELVPKGRTPFDEIVVKADLEKGTLSLNTSTLTGKSMTSMAKGQINLGARLIDVSGQGRLTSSSKKPKFTFTLKGDLFEPEFVVVDKE